MKNKLKNTLLKKTYILAIFPLRGPAWAFVGCWGLRGLSWISCTYKKNTFKKKTYLWPKRRQTRRLGPFPSSWASFSLFVGLSWLLWAFVGLHGCRPRQRGGVVGVVQPAELYSTQPPAWRVCMGRVTDSGMHGSGVLPGLPALIPASTRTRDPQGLA